MKCSNCGAEIGNARFCEYCGAQISANMLREQEMLNKQGCPKCGSTNIGFNREYQGEYGKKRNKQVLHQTIGICKDCGHTWYPNGKEKKRKTWLWVLGWIFIFPVPLTIILLKKKELKPALRYGIIAAAWVVFIVLAIVSRGSGGRSSRSTEQWPTGTFADRLPVYSGQIDHVFIYDDEISISVDRVKAAAFQDYIAKCKEAGFDRDIKSGNTEFRAFDGDGYKLKLSYSSYLEDLTIMLQEPISKGAETISWSKNAFTERVPVPTSLLGKIDADFSSVFRVYLTGISKEEFKAYVADCRSSGFDVDYSSYDDRFHAEDAEGYSLTVIYEGNNTISIELFAPDEEEDETETETESGTEEAGSASEAENISETENTSETEKETEKITEAPTQAPEKATSKSSASGYEAIYNEYAQKLRDKTPELIKEFEAEAKTNTEGIAGLAEIYSAKLEVLAQIETDGVSEMADYMLRHGSGKYEEYSEWAGKLYAVYEEEGLKLNDYYYDLAS